MAPYIFLHAYLVNSCVKMLEIILVRVGGWLGGWLGGRTVIIRLNSVQLQLQLPAGTELGNNHTHGLMTKVTGRQDIS